MAIFRRVRLRESDVGKMSALREMISSHALGRQGKHASPVPSKLFTPCWIMHKANQCEWIVIKSPWRPPILAILDSPSIDLYRPARGRYNHRDADLQINMINRGHQGSEIAIKRNDWPMMTTRSSHLRLSLTIIKQLLWSRPIPVSQIDPKWNKSGTFKDQSDPIWD